MLTLVDVPGYLLDRGLVSPRSIVDGDLVVRDLSSRNHNFGAQCRAAPSHLLKQARDPHAGAVPNEVEVYRLLAAEPGLRGHLPAFHGYDADAQVLVVEYLPDAVELGSYHHRRRRPPTGVAAAVGAALAALHRLPPSRSSGPAPGRKRLAFLTPHRPDLAVYRTATGAYLELIRIIQGTPGFGDRLDELGRMWAATAFTHDDVRLANVLLTTSPRRPRVALVDWELAGPGDPRWDIGSALGSYLTLWLSSIPMSAAQPPARAAELAVRPLSGVQPAMRACWRSYVEALGLDAGTAYRLLLGTVPFVAARLVHTAREAAQANARLTGDLLLHLQVAHNMLMRPEQAAVHLLGLPPDGAGDTGRGPGPR